MKLTNLPINQNDLTDFIKFWSLILDGLYFFSSKKNIDSLEILKNYWNEIVQD
ncbi:uncharacterized protein ASCRUDRAFT_75919 [Ascoidea rubescens DSM 1968]|uniref:Transcriptional protein SWT1 C-terminal domain-containing protein n=1 Tax=Ascoidea rubescens DSM 1968 TaxID=1344418 RepID=A0A1D2VHT3_9ASCO|nr:hypothetical protein ASCRUDRAFT_75919 [Ascoidea rubescens DSM 1968]ODV61214.1 hypothetical protein ASCRUDRAFT_75919 [Ascoidea rubescens DSM 1968]